MSSPALARRIPSLDGLRAISIGFVVGGHLVQTNGSPVPAGALRDHIISLGPLGVRVFFVISGSWALGHAWSLSVEEQFYLLWPAGLLLLGRRHGLRLAALTLVACPLVRLAYFYLVPSLVDEEMGYRFETVVDALAIGALLAGAQCVHSAHPVWQRAAASRLFIAVPIMVLLVSMTDQRLLTNVVAGVTLQNVGIAACLAWVLARPSGRIGRVLNHRALVWVGMTSYSI